MQREIPSIVAHWRDEGWDVDLVLWEHLDDDIKLPNKQAYYNEILKSCDIVLVAYWGELGKFTLAEYLTALQNYSKTGKPRIFIYKKTLPLPPNLMLNPENVNNLQILEAELAASGREQWQTKFEHEDTVLKKMYLVLQNHLRHQFKDQLKVKTTERRYFSLIGDEILFGREVEIKAIGKALWEEGAALITLVGPGGSGKSVLASKVARLDQGQFRNGAVFVQLAPIRDPKMIIPSIYAMLDDLSLGLDGDPLKHLIRDLRDMQIMLILDNCEYMAVQVGLIAKAITSNCPGVKLIATSQVPLETNPQRIIPVLPLPKPSEEDDIDTMLRNPSVNLFMHHALEFEPNFKLSTRTKDAVNEICRRRSGLPLHIILVASAMSMMSVEEIVEKLAGSQVGKTELYGVKSRKDDHPAHGSEEQAIAWSFGLLNAGEQNLLLRLGVFPDDFTIDAAAFISDNPKTVFDQLERLRNVSLLTTSSTKNNEKTFFLFESIRLFSVKKAEALLNWEETRLRFVEYYLRLCHDFTKGFFTPQQKKWLNTIDKNYNNIIEATKIAGEKNKKVVAEFIASLWRFWEVKARYREGISQIQTVINDSANLGETYLELLHGLGMLYYRGGDAKSANLLFERHREASRHFVDNEFGKRNLAQALNNISNSLSATDPEEAKIYLHEAREVFESYNDQRMIAVCLNNLGNHYLYTEDLIESRTFYQKSLDRFRQEKNDWESGYPLFGLGAVNFQLQNLKEAKQFLNDAYEKRKLSGDKRNMGRCECYLGLVSLFEEDVNTAVERLKAANWLLTQAADKLTISELHLAIVLLSVKIHMDNQAIRLLAYVKQEEKMHLPRMQFLLKTSEKAISKSKKKIGVKLYNQLSKHAGGLTESDVANMIVQILSQENKVWNETAFK